PFFYLGCVGTPIIESRPFFFHLKKVKSTALCISNDPQFEIYNKLAISTLLKLRATCKAAFYDETLLTAVVNKALKQITTDLANNKYRSLNKAKILPGYRRILAGLLKIYGTDLNKLLISSIKAHDLELMKEVIKDKRLNFLKCAADGKTSLSSVSLRLAATDQKIEFLVFLLNLPSTEPEALNNKLVREAAINGQIETVKILLKHPKVDPTVRNNEAIIKAGINGHKEIVDLFLLHPRVANSLDKNQLLKFVAIAGRTAIVKELLKDPNIDPSVENNKTIRRSMKNNHLDIVMLLLEHPKVLASLPFNEVIYFQTLLHNS
ncbi:MAG: hypothetical protein K0S74_1665, partial [Chlamydiales bacterium]|nr:hypothetical protein [Chlamydiales bacterium]